MNPQLRLRNHCAFTFVALLTLPSFGGCGFDATVSGLDRIAETSHGTILGVASPYASEITVYRGVPYAAPPVGELRWQPPQPASTWEEPLIADRFAASCYQQRHVSTFVWRREDFEVSEDCLYLNVWTPREGKDLPVMIWFHGGSHTSGQGHSLIFDGTSLASQEVVLVTINYRLGPFGFLAHTWLADESPRSSAGNYGLLDKIAALKWVKANARAFRGNPDNVTIFGQSAGSQSVCTLMTSPLAQGLFEKAIGQSASCAHHSALNPGSNLDTKGYIRGAALVNAVGSNDLAALRSADAEDVLRAALSTNWETGSRITLDGWVVPESPVQVFASSRQAPVPLLLGYMADEGVELLPKNPDLTEVALKAFARVIAAEKGPQLVAAYSTSDSTPGEIQFSITTDYLIAFGMRQWAKYQAKLGQPTYFYYVDHVPPAFHIYMPEQPELQLPGGRRSGGAYHSGDLALVFGTTDKVGLDWAEDDHQVSQHMVRYWTNFAKTGDPNGHGLPIWQPFDASNRATQVIALAPSSRAGIDKQRLDLMDTIWPIH